MPAKKPQDHKVKDDAKSTDATITWNGNDYTISAEAMDNLELFEAIEENRHLTAMKGFLGTDQWNRFKDSCRDAAGRVPMSDAEDFLQKVMEAVGNLPASPNS